MVRVWSVLFFFPKFCLLVELRESMSNSVRSQFVAPSLSLSVSVGQRIQGIRDEVVFLLRASNRSSSQRARPYTIVKEKRRKPMSLSCQRTWPYDKKKGHLHAVPKETTTCSFWGCVCDLCAVTMVCFTESNDPLSPSAEGRTPAAGPSCACFPGRRRGTLGTDRRCRRRRSHA